MIADSNSPLLLIADDDRVALRMLRLVLGNEHYRVESVVNGEEALRQAEILRPDLVLLDVDMPGIDGFEVCRRLRANPELAEVPIMMLTALTDRDAKLRGIEAGADDFISKPFDHVELAARVKTITRLNRYRRVQEAHRLSQQIEMAAAIQQQLLPAKAPTVRGLEICSRYRPAAQVGGDYFDFIVRDNALYFIVADVSGHGLASALFMSNVRSAVRSLLPWTHEIKALTEAVNARMVEDAGQSGTFLSAVLGSYLPDEGAITLVNCGHPEPIIVRTSGDIETLAASTPAIGIVDHLDAEESHCTLRSGDLVCMYTDGVLEPAAPSGEMFGSDRIQDILRAGASEPLDALADAILQGVTAFHGNNSLDDDLTLVLLRKVSHA